MNMKQEQKNTKSGVLHIIGSVAFAVGICTIMPKIIEKGSDFLYSKKCSSKESHNCDDWGPEIVRRNSSEGRKNGSI